MQVCSTSFCRHSLAQKQTKLKNIFFKVRTYETERNKINLASLILTVHYDAHSCKSLIL